MLANAGVTGDMANVDRRVREWPAQRSDEGEVMR